MAEFEIPFEAHVSSYVKVEADSLEEAVEKAYIQGLPGLMHLDHTYPDVSEWEVPEWFYEENPDMDPI